MRHEPVGQREAGKVLFSCTLKALEGLSKTTASVYRATIICLEFF